MKRFFHLLYGLICAVFLGSGTFGATVDDGAQGTESGLQTRRPLQWRTALDMIDPREAPFLSMFMRLGREKTVDPEFNLFEQEDMPGWTRINFTAGYSNSDTSLVVDDGTIIGTNYRIYLPRTEEVIKVATVSTNTLDATAGRGYGASSASAILDNDWVLVLGEIITEGMTTYPVPKTVRPTLVTNYIEEFREAAVVTGTMAATTLRGPAERDRVLNIATRSFKRKIERALRVGIKDEIGTAPLTERHTGGFEQFVSTNDFDLDGAISEPDLMYIAERVFRYGTEDKLVLCGRNARLQIDMLGLENTVIAAQDRSNPLGMEITKIRTSAGTLNLVTDHFLGEGMADKIHILDLGHASLAVHREVRLERDIEVKKSDNVADEWRASVGLYIGNERSHAIVRNCTEVS